MVDATFQSVTLSLSTLHSSAFHSSRKKTQKFVMLSLFICCIVAFFHVDSLFSTGVDNEKVGLDNEKALDLDNRLIFSYFSLISIYICKYHPKMQQNILLHSDMITPNILV